MPPIVNQGTPTQTREKKRSGKSMEREGWATRTCVYLYQWQVSRVCFGSFLVIVRRPSPATGALIFAISGHSGFAKHSSRAATVSFSSERTIDR